MELKEEWKPIIGYESRYEISNLGRVKGFYHGEKILKQFKNKSGYLMTTLTKNGKSKHVLVHRLVALHFVPNPRGVDDANHIDGIKINNRIDNLEWCTKSENSKHSYKIGLQKPQIGEDNVHSKIFFQFDLSGKLLKVWKGIRDCAKQLWEEDPQIQKKYSKSYSLIANISACLNGRLKTCAGYIFSFEPIIDLKEHEWNVERRPVVATDMKTGEKFTYPSIHCLDYFIMPNGNRTIATFVCKVCKGKRKSHAGYTWEYAKIIK